MVRRESALRNFKKGEKELSTTYLTQLSYSNYVVVYQERKRGVTIHVVDKNGLRVPGAAVKLSQLSTDFPIGTMISRTILENLP